MNTYEFSQTVNDFIVSDFVRKLVTSGLSDWEVSPIPFDQYVVENADIAHYLNPSVPKDVWFAALIQAPERFDPNFGRRTEILDMRGRYRHKISYLIRTPKVKKYLDSVVLPGCNSSANYIIAGDLLHSWLRFGEPIKVATRSQLPNGDYKFVLLHLYLSPQCEVQSITKDVVNLIVTTERDSRQQKTREDRRKAVQDREEREIERE